MATMYDPPHLGELIRESVEAEGWSVTETARRLGMGRVALSRVLNGHAGVSAALALERIGWSDAEHWMRMQAIYDLAQERRRQAGAAA
jgi:addiction module HigA family antidote